MSMMPGLHSPISDPCVPTDELCDGNIGCYTPDYCYMNDPTVLYQSITISPLTRSFAPFSLPSRLSFSFFGFGGGIVCGTGIGVRSAARVLRLGRDFIGNLVLLMSAAVSAIDWARMET